MSFLAVVYLAGFVLFCLLAEIAGKCFYSTTQGAHCSPAQRQHDS